MLKQIEGSQGVAQAVALCRPDVVCAYPISPQTHIVENLGLLCRKGVLQDCEYINVESEFAAMSVAIGASVAGRTGKRKKIGGGGGGSLYGDCKPGTSLYGRSCL